METAQKTYTVAPVKYDVETHHPHMAKWWEQWGWPVMPKDFLPTTGVVVESDGVPVCGGFVMIAKDTQICWIEFVVADKEADKELRAYALDVLLASLNEEAKQAGMKYLFTSLEHPGLIERYKKHGFAVTDTGMTNMIKVI